MVDGSDADAAGVDESQLAPVRRKARHIRAEARLKAAEHSTNADEIEEACTEADAAGVDENQLVSTRQRVRRLRVEARLKGAENESEVDEMERACLQSAVADSPKKKIKGPTYKVGRKERVT